MKPFPVARYLRSRNRRRSTRTRRIVASATLALALPVAAVASSPAAGAAASRATGTAATTSSSASCPWLDQSLPVQQRVQMLMAQMSLANKINMMTGAGFNSQYVFEISAIPSLCIPQIGEEDGPLGVGDSLTGVTQLPATASLAATFDPSLVKGDESAIRSGAMAKKHLRREATTLRRFSSPKSITSRALRARYSSVVEHPSAASSSRATR